mgnify:FL=1
MLWSVSKIVVFIILVAATSIGAIYLMELQGGVRIELAGLEFNLTPIMAFIALISLVFLVWLFLKLAGLLVAIAKLINGDETALSRYFQKNRQEKGNRALSEGILALSSGEGDVAIAQARKAEKFLK